MEENVINYVCTPQSHRDKKKKKKPLVTRETKCSQPCVDEVAEEAQVDGGKGVPATRRPNRVGFRLGTRGMVGIDRMVSDCIGLRWYRLVSSGTYSVDYQV